MKKSTAVLSSLALCFLLYSCGSDSKTESALGLYQVTVPGYMNKATDLNVDASMQFQNIFKETYLAIIDEDKTEFVDAFRELGELDSSLSTIGNYRKIQIDYFLESVRVINKGEPKQITINGLAAEQIEFEGRVPGVDYDIFYIMTFVEGKEDLYMVMTWTLSSSKDKYRGDFLTMVNTFTEI
jgi:hypothetical protein